MMTIPLFVFFGCNSSETDTLVVIEKADVEDVFHTSKLSNFEIDEERMRRIEIIMESVEMYLKTNLNEIIDEGFCKKKADVELIFTHGKVSPKTIEYYINNEIERDNDEHEFNRLHTITLDMVYDENLSQKAIYYNKWIEELKVIHDNTEKSDKKDSAKRQQLVFRLMDVYNIVFNGENIYDQMINGTK